MAQYGRPHSSGALKYHHSTCHSYSSVRARHRFLDFSTKPPPFKRYRNASRIPLPPPDERLFEVPALEAIARVAMQGYTPFGDPPIDVPGGMTSSSPVLPGQDNPATEGKASPHGPFTFRSGVSTREISAILKFSMGILRRKKLGGEVFAFRAAACTGALYHIECYAATPLLHDPASEDPLAPGLYHYDPLTNSLDVLATGDRRRVFLEASGYRPESRIQALQDAGCIVLCYTSVFWRNAWKYEERSFRHAFWDTGTILANAMAIAAALGLGQSLHVAFVDGQVADALGCDLVHEAPTAILVLLPGAVRERISAWSRSPGLEPSGAAALESDEQPQVHLREEARGASRDPMQSLRSRRSSAPAVEPQAPAADRSAGSADNSAVRLHLTKSGPTEGHRVGETPLTKEGSGVLAGKPRPARLFGQAEPLPPSHAHYRAIEEAIEATAMSELDEVIGFLRRAEGSWASNAKASRNWSVARVAQLLEGAGVASSHLSDKGKRAGLRAFWRLPTSSAGSGYRENHRTGPDLGSVIASRRSTRLFADSPIDVSAFSTLLGVCSIPLPADFLGRSANVVRASTGRGGGQGIGKTRGARQSRDFANLSSENESAVDTPEEQEPSKLDETEGASRACRRDATPADELGTFAGRSLLFQAVLLTKGVVRQDAESRRALAFDPGAYICVFEREKGHRLFEVRSTYGQGPDDDQAAFARIEPQHKPVAPPISVTANGCAASNTDGAFEARLEWQLRQHAAFLALEQAAAGFAAVDIFHLADMALVIDVLGERGYRAAQLEGGIRGGLTYLAAHALGLRACGLTFYDHETIRFFFPDPSPQHWKELTGRSSAAVSQTPYLPRPAAGALSLEEPKGGESTASCAARDLGWDIGVMFLTAVGERRRKSQKVSEKVDA